MITGDRTTQVGNADTQVNRIEGLQNDCFLILDEYGGSDAKVKI